MGYNFLLHLTEHQIDSCVQEYNDTKEDEDSESIRTNKNDSHYENDQIFVNG
jgi:hypothetical protein